MNQTISFTKENHAAALKQISKLQKSFVKATIKTSSHEFEINSFDYLLSYCSFYYNFTATVEA